MIAMGSTNGEWLKLGVDGVVPIHWSATMAKDDDTGELEGWASVYNVVDAQDDIVVPGAFTKTMQLWRQNGRTIALTNAHDNTPAGVIGSVRKASDTAYGLKLRFGFSAAPDAQSIRAKAKEGHVTGLSIFGPIIKHAFETRDGRELRLIQEAGLWTVGLTPVPVNAQSLVTSAKDGGGGDPPPDEGGMSDVWICDMKSALAISRPTARKAAVDVLVRAQYKVVEETAADSGTPTTEPVTDADASTYALNLIGESGPDNTSPGGEPGSGSLADQLLATLSAATTSADIEALAAEIGMPREALK
jgi:HK97 family phage prohead protease